MRDSLIASQIYVGNVRHRRFLPKRHSFSYFIYMLALDVQEMEHKLRPTGIFGYSWFHPLRFVEKDYLKGNPGTLSTRIKNKVKELNGDSNIDRIIMLAQVRCFGIYFSPVNFYFCYDQEHHCKQMLAEVSNTPWNERHYYLVDLQQDKPFNEKVFNVSPFMSLDMSYYWRIKPPQLTSSKLLVHIENKSSTSTTPIVKVFDATLAMSKRPFTRKELYKLWLSLPIMTVKIVVSIYWQALKLLCKKVPFLGYQKHK